MLEPDDKPIYEALREESLVVKRTAARWLCMLDKYNFLDEVRPVS